MRRTCTIPGGDKPLESGPGRALTIIAGPCVMESLELSIRIARTLREVCDECGFGYVFKASFDKANRSSGASPRGPGIAPGLEHLAAVRREIGCPVTTDVHETDQATLAGEVVDVIQIPAFLCRQTDLLLAAGRAAHKRGAVVNVKKGQFVSPREMVGPLRKLREAGCANAMVTERGTFFGYHRLVNDFIGVGDLLELDDGSGSGPPVCFDVTHSTQLPGAGETSGGRPERSPMLALAAAAAGVDALFLECHPDPPRAASDASTALALEAMPGILRRVRRVWEAAREDR
ncbi:MAG: 3-deoxy-8-phosphooctulonate synthase [Phycisphaerales bacterium]|nr:3-deoxy-8-phosphooctulonate synthase [Phycisphaerales bacterium]